MYGLHACKYGTYGVCIYIYIYMYTYMYMYTYLYICIHTCKQSYIHTFSLRNMIMMYVCMYVWFACMHVGYLWCIYKYTYMYICMYICIHTCKQSYIHTFSFRNMIIKDVCMYVWFACMPQGTHEA
jgi:hypothetical protein